MNPYTPYIIRRNGRIFSSAALTKQDCWKYTANGFTLEETNWKYMNDVAHILENWDNYKSHKHAPKDQECKRLFAIYQSLRGQFIDEVEPGVKRKYETAGRIDERKRECIRYYQEPARYQAISGKVKR